ncbi:hypothetical protein Trydic_g20443 [Trypoxylus dichotomus]
MQQRRRKKDDAIGCNLNRIIKRKAKEAKEADIIANCIDIEILQAKHDNFNVYRKVKEVTETHRRRHLIRLSKNEGNTIINTAELKDEWIILNNCFTTQDYLNWWMIRGHIFSLMKL